MSNVDREIREAARLRQLLEEVERKAAEQRIEPATMPEGVLGRWPTPPATHLDLVGGSADVLATD